MPTKPSTPDPNWGYSAPVGAIVEPPLGLRDAGWSPNDPHPAQYQNWLDNRYSQWITWLRATHPDSYEQMWTSTLGLGTNSASIATDGTLRVIWGNSPSLWRVPISVPVGYIINSYGCVNTLVGTESVTLRLERRSSSSGIIIESSHTFPNVPAGDPTITTVTAVEDPIGLPYTVTSPGGLAIAVFMNTAAGLNSYLYNVFCEVEPSA